MQLAFRTMLTCATRMKMERQKRMRRPQLYGCQFWGMMRHAPSHSGMIHQTLRDSMMHLLQMLIQWYIILRGQPIGSASVGDSCPLTESASPRKEERSSAVHGIPRCEQKVRILLSTEAATGSGQITNRRAHAGGSEAERSQQDNGWCGPCRPAALSICQKEGWWSGQLNSPSPSLEGPWSTPTSTLSTRQTLQPRESVGTSSSCWPRNT